MDSVIIVYTMNEGDLTARDVHLNLDSLAILEYDDPCLLIIDPQVQVNTIIAYLLLGF